MSTSPIVVLGNQQSGKTALLRKLQDKPMGEQYEETIGVEYSSLGLTDGESKPVWEICGNRHFATIHETYLKKASMVVIVLDLRKSIEVMAESLNYWLERLNSCRQSPCPVVVLANTFNEEDVGKQTTIAALAKKKKLQFVSLDISAAANLPETLGQYVPLTGADSATRDKQTNPEETGASAAGGERQKTKQFDDTFVKEFRAALADFLKKRVRYRVKNRRSYLCGLDLRARPVQHPLYDVMINLDNEFYEDKTSLMEDYYRIIRDCDTEPLLTKLTNNIEAMCGGIELTMIKARPLTISP